jgi:glutathione S-transferase
MLKLYFTPGTCALASHIALAEAGADYTVEKVDFKANQQNSPDYLAINPKGRTVGACFALIEGKMLKGPWVMGEQYTICDPYLYTIATWLEGDGVDMAKLPGVADHRRRMAERAAVKKALAEEQA